ncbi:MAG: phospholipid carrier-dependent glycosyltransferase [Chloroflexi bacterium]|nr:phospholipid carrier-dependent glycosyltransferase [Chloroflexota bacterium]
MPADIRFFRLIWIILLTGLLLRLAFSLSQPTYSTFDTARGGDTGWYLANGYGFFSGEKHGWVEKMPFYIERIPTPPLYILYAGFFQQVLSRHETILAMRLLQCLASMATVYLAFRLSLLISRDRRVASLITFLAAFHPAFVVEPANIATETLYVFFLALGFWIYLNYVVNALFLQCTYKVGPQAAIILTAMAFALATLTRAVAVLFPFVIVLHLLLLGRRQLSTVWRRLSVLLIVVYALVVATWTIYNIVLWGRLVIVSDQLLPALWRGAVTQDGSPAQNDALLLQDSEVNSNDDCHPDCKYQHPPELYLEQIGESVEDDIAGFIARRLKELSFSLIQPHGTAEFGGASIREAAGELLRQNRSLEGIITVLQLEGFALKGVVWIIHLGGMALGLLGMWHSRGNLWLTFPLVGFVLYTIVAHLFLLALPRYMFPLEVVWLIFAGISAVKLYDHWRGRANESSSVSLEAG